LVTAEPGPRVCSVVCRAVGFTVDHWRSPGRLRRAMGHDLAADQSAIVGRRVHQKGAAEAVPISGYRSFAAFGVYFLISAIWLTISEAEPKKKRSADMHCRC